MSQKIALVTGANKGIGLETARGIARHGVHVIVAARDGARGAAAVEQITKEGGRADAVQLDVTDAASIARAVAAVGERHGRLDVLVNNAAVMIDDFARSPSQQDLATWRETFEVNVFGQVAVTNAFLPLLRASDAARIVNVSSILGSLADSLDPNSPFYDFKIPAYNISKSALNAWTIHLAHELRGSSITVNAVHPGYVRTEMHGVSDAPMSAEEGARTSIRMAVGAEETASGQFRHEEDVLAW